MKNSNLSVAKILIADAPIPWPGYGSWSQRIEYLLQQYEHNVFDYVICMDSKTEFVSKKTKRFNCKVHSNRFMNKLFSWWRFKDVKQALAKINVQHEGMIICIMDSLRTKHAVWNFVNDIGAAHKSRLVYYQCGFSTYLPSDKYNKLTEGISDFIYLTRNAYEFELTHNPALPFVAHVLHNPIDHQKFFVPSENDKQQYRKELGMHEGVHFIWASQDRPKKGLEVVLQAWRKFYRPELNVTLNVIGVQRNHSFPGVVFHGKKPNYEIHQYLKAADIGVFSPLWTEGFGLSLAEQISCGLLCVASTAGGVEEYFVDGEHGFAIEHPNFIASWELGFEKALAHLPLFRQQLANRTFPVFLTYDAWCQKFCSIFDEIASYHFHK